MKIRTNRLAVDRMSLPQLFRRADVTLTNCRPLNHRGPKDLDISLNELQAILQEIEMRGQQLQLVPDPQSAHVPPYRQSIHRRP